MRRRTSRGSLLVTLLALSALVLSFAAPAQAQPAPPPGDDTPDDTVEQENQGRDSADIGEYDYYSIDECRAQFSGENEGTKYKNHFASCQIDWGIYVHNACVDDVCGEVGRQKFRMTQIGFGSRTQQTMRFETAIDAWQPEGLINDSAPFSAQYLCANRLETDSCTSTNPGVVTRSIGEWKANPTMPNVVFDTSASVGGGDGQHRDADRVNYHTLRFLTVGSDPGVHETITPFRCDAATYLRASGACIFHTVDAVHKVSVLPEDGTQEVALHIMTALGSPDQTFPEVADKFIPGSLQDVVPLTRLYSGYDDNSQRDRNRATARATCVAEWGAHYSRGPQGPRDCDEFPFASTFEGAYRSLILPELGSYSANVINSAQNQRHGRELGKYYVEDHILHGDRFFVQVTGCDGCGGDPPPKPPVGNTPPTVDAGPDVNATEGNTTALAGSVTDPDDAPSVNWTYALGGDTDPGMTCTFGNAAAPATTISCTDDGTVTVTLTADDGHGSPSPVSDTATVHLSNVAPDMTLTGPQAWQLYRVDTSVALTAPFTDPGANDTHTCTVDWDDGGGPAAYPAANHTCDTSRTFDHAGMFTINLTVADDDGGTDMAQVMVVVYDPRAGFVTSLGAMDSPRGALTSKPDAHGLATFLFAAKYLFQSSTRPTGSALDFVLPAHFGFVSTDLDWLVITPDSKVALKGTGRVNGRSGYGFVIYAEAHEFRLVVWPLSQGPNPTGRSLYDNRPNAGYDVDVADPQPITLGLTIIDTGWVPGLPPPPPGPT